MGKVRFALLKGLVSGLLTAVAWVSNATASAVTFVTALPVAQDQILVRFNFEMNLQSRQFTGFQFPVNIGYGLTSKWTIFVNLNQGFGSLNANGSQGPANLSTGGSGDTGLYARYTLFKIDRPRSTFRIAPLAGAFLPAGGNALHSGPALLPAVLQTGSGTVDPYVGIAIGYNTSKWGVAADTTYRYNPIAGAGISPGSELRTDGEFEFGVLPRKLPEEGLPKELFVSLEANYIRDGNAHVNGTVSPLSSGKSFRADAFLEWTTLHWQLGAGPQLPLMQDLAGIGRIRQRVTAYVFFEYYLFAPSWRHTRKHA